MHNNLIDAKSEEAYTAFELDFIKYAISTIAKDDKEFKTIVINISELYEEVYGSPLTGKTRREVLEKLTSLDKKSISFAPKDEKDKIVITHWFQWIEYTKHEGSFIVELNKRLTDYLLGLKKDFTSISSKIFLMDKGYTKRLYELMSKIYLPVTQRKFEIDELRQMLMIGDKYQDNYNFRKNVIERAIKDINEFADFTLSYEQVKEGRKVTHIKFTKHHKKNTAPNTGKERDIEDIASMF